MKGSKIMKTIDKIIFIIEQKGIVPSQMAKDLGFSSGLYSQWKSGLQNPSAEKLFKIAEYLDCSVDYLLDRTDDPKIIRNSGNNINQQNIGGNATANIGTDDSERSDADAHELLDMIKQLSIVQRAEIILKINEMLNEK